MKRLLGFTRYVVLLGVVGNLIAAAVLFFSGVVQVAKIGGRVTRYLADPHGLKQLAIESIQLADGEDCALEVPRTAKWRADTR